MLGQRDIRSGDALQQAVVDHAPGAVAGLLGGLEQRDQGPVPLAAMTGQKLARPGQAGHMDVVTAGMRHRHFLAVTIPGGHGARVIRAGVLPYGQGVHVSPQQDRRPAAVG